MKKEIVYLANARLPTEKAHGLQIVKMCEAFAHEGVDVTLIHPFRRQPDSHRGSQNVFDYYGIAPVFRVRTLKNWDISPFNFYLSDSLFSPLFFIQSLLWAMYALRIISHEKANVYYTRDAEVAYELTKRELPTVYEVHTVPYAVRRGLVRRLVLKRSLKLLVVLTRFIRDQFIQWGFPPHKVLVLPDAVDLNLFQNLPNQEECRRRLGLPLDYFILGYVGRFHTLEREKGIPELICALKFLLASKLSIKPLLLCVGGPMERVPSYLSLANKLGIPGRNLLFVDWVPHGETPLWIRSFNLALAPFPSTPHYSYFMSPLKIFEYLASGVPLVATDLPSLREVLCHGENAWLVEPGNPEALARGIQRVMEDPALRERLSQGALESAQRYTWSARAKTILDFLKSHDIFL